MLHTNDVDFLMTGMRTIFLVLAAFLLTWIPMLVLALLEMIRYLGGLGNWTPPHWLYVFAMWSMCAGSVTYPILYGIYNRAIRKELRICLSCSGGLNTKKWRTVNHFYHHGGSGHGGHGGGIGQRRGSKWSNYSGPSKPPLFCFFLDLKKLWVTTICQRRIIFQNFFFFYGTP